MIYRFFGRFPLRIVLIVPFVIILLTTTGLTGYFGYHNSQRSVNDLADQLHNESAARISQQLNSYLETPLLVNDLSLDAIRLRQLDVNDQEELWRHFLAQIQRFDSIVALTYAADNKSYGAAVWRDLYGANLGLALLSEETNDVAKGYEITPQGEIGKLAVTLTDYDPRVRPWYQTAVTTGGPAWTPVFMWTTETVGIDAVVPVYADDGRLLGVLDASLTLDGIGDFLQNAQVSDNGQTFIVDEAGLLVASSTIQEPFTRTGEEVTRFAASECDDPTTRAAAQKLASRFGDWTNIHAHHHFYFEVGGERQFAQVTPYQNNGLRWWIVVVIPESDFMARIDANNRNTTLLMAGSLLAAVLVTTWLARWVTRPILRLNRASKALAAGNWSPKVAVNRWDEVGELARSFYQMAEQQHTLFSSLQTSEMRFRAIFESSVDAIGVTKTGLFVTVNPAFLAMFGCDSLADVAGKSPLDFIAPVEHSRILTYIRQRAEGEAAPSSYETLGLRCDGSVFDVEVRVSTYHLEGEVYTVAILRDITERKRSEEAYRKLVDYSLQGLIIVQEWRIVFANQAVAEMSGYTIEELLALSPEEVQALIHPDDQAFVWDRARKRLANEPVPDRYEFRFIRKDSTVKWLEQYTTLVEYKGKPAAQTAYVDITERKRSEEAERRQRILAQTFQRVAEALSSSGQLDDVLNFVLGQLGEILPYDRAVLLTVEGDVLRVTAGRDFSSPDKNRDILNSYFAYQANSLFYEPMTTGQPGFVSDTQNDPRWRLMPDTFHTVRAWIGVPLIVWDITIGLLSVGSLQPYAYDTDDVETARTFARQVALAIETSRIYSQLETSLVDLQRMRMRLTQTERLAMAGEIAAGIAHQIRNPLTAIVAQWD